jgi:drug/metabolite transporter (DMT)-like permease
MIIAVNPLLTIFLMTILAQMEVEWFASEQIHWRGYLGALLVVTGVILTVSRLGRLSVPKSPSTI